MASAMARQGGVRIPTEPVRRRPGQQSTSSSGPSGCLTHRSLIGPQHARRCDALCARYRISGVPVTDASGVLLGIVTNRDLRFETDPGRSVGEVMTQMPLVTAPEDVRGDEAMALLRKHKVEKLPLVDSGGRLTGLITVKDFVKSEQSPTPKDAGGRSSSACRRRGRLTGSSERDARRRRCRRRRSRHATASQAGRHRSRIKANATSTSWAA